MRRRNLGRNPNRMPVGNLPGWTQVIAEDFLSSFAQGDVVVNTNGDLTAAGAAFTNYGTKLQVFPYQDTTKHKTDHLGKFNPAILSCDGSRTTDANGVISINMRNELVAGVLTGFGSTLKLKRPDGAYRQLYGRMKFRIKVDAVGTAPNGFVVLIEGIDSRPGMWAGGEYGFPETGTGTDATWKGWNHFAGTVTPPAQQRIEGDGTLQSAYAIHEWIWSPGHLVWTVNGKPYLDTTDRVPSTVMELLAQCEPDIPLGAAGNTSRVAIDWWVIYDYTP